MSYDSAIGPDPDAGGALRAHRACPAGQRRRCGGPGQTKRPAGVMGGHSSIGHTELERVLRAP